MQNIDLLQEEKREEEGALSSPPLQHVALIMDGNRRWARRRGLPTMAGHVEGVSALMRTLQAAQKLNIGALTVYAFSTENWQRSYQEVRGLLQLIGDSLMRFQEQMIEEGVRLYTIGDLSRFPDGLVRQLEETCAATAAGEKIAFILALNYGGRDDLCRAAARFAQEVAEGKARPSELTESLLARYLDTSHWPDPELVIRTSGELRLSNFLLWQASYSEIVSLDCLWPDFGEEELREAIACYYRRQRRWGG